MEGRKRHTTVTIDGERFFINGRPTYEGVSFNDWRVEGLLLNSRMVQGVFDDANPETVGQWAYPDTGVWDPERNTREFIAAMRIWRDHGILGFTINLQGGNPRGYGKGQPWINTAFNHDGSMKADYLRRLEAILDRADELGMVPIVGVFYFGQDERLADEQAVKRGLEHSVCWLLEKGYTNVLLEVCNETNVPRYEHEILTPCRVHELVVMAKGITRNDRRLLVGVSYGGGFIPLDNVIAVSDFLLIHGNGVKDPNRIASMVDELRSRASYRPMPILFNEDDHFDFDKPWNNMLAAISRYASWGYFDPGKSNYVDGYQAPPVNWGLSTERKRAFFELAARIARYPGDVPGGGPTED